MKTKKQRTARSYLTNNLTLKIISLVFAIILWSFVTNTTNPERTKTVIDVPVVVHGLEELEAKGLTLRDDLSKNVPTVKVKVSVKNSDFRLVNKNVIVAAVDVSEITRDGSNTVSIVATFANTVGVSLVSVEPQVLNLTVDKLMTKDVPVSLTTTGVLPEGLVSLAPSFASAFTVSGSSYYVDRIANAVVNVDLATLSDGKLVSSLCTFTDSDGNVIKFNGVPIDVDMDVQTIKSLPVDLTGAVVNSDKVLKGYIYKGITANNVTVCGHVSDLQKISKIAAMPVDLTGKDSSFSSTSLMLDLPQGISVLGEMPKARIDIEAVQTERTEYRSITVTGVPANKTVSVLNGSRWEKFTKDGTSNIRAEIRLTGPETVLNKTISQADIIVQLEVNKKNGTYVLEPRVKLSAALSALGVTGDLVMPAQLEVKIEDR